MPIYNARIVEVDAAETRRYAGLRKAENFGEKNIRDACAEALLLLNVRGVWEIYDYDDANHTVASEPPFTIVGNSIIKHLAGCEKVICMSATVGEEIEREVTKKFERGDYLASVLLDAAATAAVEQAADEMEKHFALTFAKDGFKLRWRFSPGYGDWNLTEQPKLFAAAGARQIGLNLSSAFMLEPRKSITAIIGLERATSKKICSPQKKSCGNVTLHPTDAIELEVYQANSPRSNVENNSCRNCNRVDCPSRKI